MWNGAQNVNALFTAVSYGKVSFPRHLGKIITVRVTSGKFENSKNCKFWNIGLEADRVVRETHGYYCTA